MQVGRCQPFAGPGEDLRRGHTEGQRTAPQAEELRNLPHQPDATGQLIGAERILHPVLNTRDIMVLQIGSDRWQVMSDLDPERLQVFRRPDAGQLEEVRRVHRTAREDHLPSRPQLAHLAVLAEGYADAAPALEQQPGRLRLGLDPHLVARPGEEGPRGRAAPATHPGHLRIADPLLFRAVQVALKRMPGLLRRLNEAVGQRQDGAVVLHLQRAVAAAEPGGGAT